MSRELNDIKNQNNLYFSTEKSNINENCNNIIENKSKINTKTNTELYQSQLDLFRENKLLKKKINSLKNEIEERDEC